MQFKPREYGVSMRVSGDPDEVREIRAWIEREDKRDLKWLNDSVFGVWRPLDRSHLEVPCVEAWVR